MPPVPRSKSRASRLFRANEGDEDHPLHRETLQDGGQHGLQRLSLGHIAGVDRVHERQAIGRLDDAEDELAGDASGLLVHPEGAEVVVHLRLAVGAHGGQVIAPSVTRRVDQLS